MQGRTLFTVSLAALSVACATGVLEPRSASLERGVEPLPEGGEHGVVQGFVHEEATGRPLAGALVIVMCSCLTGHREIETNADGLYQFRDLPPGKYTVQVLFGHANVNKSFEVTAGTRRRSDFRVAPEDRFRIG